MEKTTDCTARSPEDVLGYIPHAIGFQPRDSLVCLTATGKELGAILRVDLPRAGASRARLRDHALAVLAYLSHDAAADGTFLALYQEAPVAQLQSRHAAFLSILESMLSGAGRPVRECWLIGADGWNGSGCRLGECLLGLGRGGLVTENPCRHPLELISNSALAAEMVFRGSAVQAHPDDASDSPGRVPDPRRSASSGEDPGSPGGDDGSSAGPSAEELTGALAEWEPLLDGSQSWAGLLPDTGWPERLGRTLEVPALRDAVYVSAADGHETALRGSLKDGPSWRERFGAVIIAETGEGPDWARMDRFAEVLGRLRRETGDGTTAAVLTALGWVEWCRGRGTHASAVLRRAARKDPELHLARLLLELVLMGRLSGWSTRRDSSWRRSPQTG
ncbi:MULTISPECIES: DUF4192 family protein [Arthrobacter]|uniref:DUF4192 family protein n=2 Tax=Arthrobacter TaxID=1663 RepID=A0ABU9KHC1_9MICC|nr:DUF4192 family protein [Arthrobacter sp. YJM1]MDP5226166.1 DUF4192 family protein [Arthrobacter sp. YJM1]